MQSVTSLASRRLRRSGRALAGLVASVTVGIAVTGTADAAPAECPWVVKPYVSETVSSAKGDGAPAYEILFEGSEKAQAFYAFSLASQGATSAGTVEVAQSARRLEPVATPIGPVYRLPPDAARPETIYLVAAEAPVDKLEQIEARIEPAAPPTEVAALNFRGASNVTGQLPHRSVRGHQIASADLQICAYEVAMQ